MTVNDPRLFSYVVKHDSGFAPNPYAGALTLATCKPRIRATAIVGDWLLGTGSVQGVGYGRVVYAGKVCEVLAIDEYGMDPRFASKRPVLQQSWRRHGDNIYFRDRNANWHQRRSIHHSLQDIEHDLGGKNVLICEKFWYFGAKAPLLPDAFLRLCKKGQGHKCESSPVIITELVAWLAQFDSTVLGSPYDDRTNDHKLPRCRIINPEISSSSVEERSYDLR